jgi:hypothetical protein
MSIKNAQSIALSYQPYLSWVAAGLACLCALSVLLYGIFLLEAVGHAAASEIAQRNIQGLRVSISTMEAQYLAYTRNITPQTAQALGFVTPTALSTVFARSPAQSLTLR